MDKTLVEFLRDMTAKQDKAYSELIDEYEREEERVSSEKFGSDWVDDFKTLVDNMKDEEDKAVFGGSHEFELGDYVEDKVTGFGGLITGIATYLYSETAYQVEPEDLGKTPSKWFAGGRLEYIGHKEEE